MHACVHTAYTHEFIHPSIQPSVHTQYVHVPMRIHELAVTDLLLLLLLLQIFGRTQISLNSLES